MSYELSAISLCMHPWEIDPEQPRVKEASLNYRFRHYTNLGKTKAKLIGLIDAFLSCQFTTCSEYLKQAIKPESREAGRLIV